LREKFLRTVYVPCYRPDDSDPANVEESDYAYDTPEEAEAAIGREIKRRSDRSRYTVEKVRSLFGSKKMRLRW
jgi:hypothetical protein